MRHSLAPLPTYRFASMAADAAARRLSVLVVDDNRHTADTLAERLRVKGHNARVAYGREQALVIVRVWRPDVAILDVAADGVSGVELAKRLRNESADPIMLVALTWLGASDEIVRRGAGAFDHRFVKPLNPDELLGLLDTQARRRPPDSG